MYMLTHGLGMPGRYDRLLLKWASPSSQQEEVTGYIVRFFDTEPRWPVKHEIEASRATSL